MNIRQVHPVFVGEVSDIDITQPLTRDQVAAIEAGMDRYAVLAFHDQALTDELNIEWTASSQPDYILNYQRRCIARLPVGELDGIFDQLSRGVVREVANGTRVGDCKLIRIIIQDLWHGIYATDDTGEKSLLDQRLEELHDTPVYAPLVDARR